MSYRLLDQFKNTFEGQKYKHRLSTLGDAIAIEFFEDLVTLNGATSSDLKERIAQRSSVLNRANRTRGRVARRGDGTFGRRVPSAEAVTEDGFEVGRGQIATVEIGAEVKILAKAMLKQIDRVISDLGKQVEHFRRGGPNAISVGIVGINFAETYRSFEGERVFVTDGRRYAHPIDEAAKAEQRLIAEAGPRFDELVILQFRATNLEPFPFEWVDAEGTEHDYSAALVRVSDAYSERFGH